MFHKMFDCDKIAFMNQEERVFKEDWNMEYDILKGEIIWFLKSHPNLALRSLCNDPIGDIFTWTYNNDYRPEFIRYNDEELASYFITIDLIKIFLNSKNKNITSIEIPSKAFEDPSWLLDFPDLETIITDSFSLDDGVFDFIKKNTKIKRINSQFIHSQNQEGLVVHANQSLIKWDETVILKYQDGDLELSGTTYDPNSFNIKVHDLTSDLLPILEKLKSYSDVKRFEILDNQGVSLKYSKDDKRIVYNDNIHPEILKRISNILEQNGYVFDNICLYVNNQTYKNFYALKGLDSHYQFDIYYEDSSSTSYENFLYMREAIDYYKYLINAYDLSPLEKIMYAYDLMKSYKYNEPTKRPSTSRNIPEIVTSGEIVCGGYSTFFKQLLLELGIHSERIDVIIYGEEHDNYHERNIVHVDDEKYDVHGDFVFDSTWDSYKELYQIRDKEGRISIKQTLDEDDEIIEKYSRMPLYRYFLVPAKDYLAVFKGEKLPSVLTNENNNYNKRLYLEQQFDIEKPDLETFRQILYRVRLAQGYPPESAVQEVDDVVFVNEYICSHYAGIPFFGQGPNRGDCK